MPESRKSRTPLGTPGRRPDPDDQRSSVSGDDSGLRKAIFKKRRMVRHKFVMGPLAVSPATGETFREPTLRFDRYGSKPPAPSKRPRTRRHALLRRTSPKVRATYRPSDLVREGLLMLSLFLVVLTAALLLLGVIYTLATDSYEAPTSPYRSYRAPMLPFPQGHL